MLNCVRDINVAERVDGNALRANEPRIERPTRFREHLAPGHGIDDVGDS